MSRDGKLYLKPGSLAHEKNSYLQQRNSSVKENLAKFDALGLKKMANPFTSSAQRTKSTTTGKRSDEMDCALDDDPDYQPLQAEDGISSSSEDDDCFGPPSYKSSTTRKFKRAPAGPMIDALMEPHHTSCETQVRAKRVRCRAAPMTAILQPSLTNSHDQHANQSSSSYHGYQSPSGEVASQIDEKPVEPQSHEHSTSNRTYPELPSQEQSNEGLRTSVGTGSNLQEKRARGLARPHVGWGTGTKLEVKLNKQNQPIGDTSAPLQSQLGILARNAYLATLCYTDWRAPELNLYKERIWADVQANTTAPDVYKHNCLKSVGKKWRDWKEEIKRTAYDIYDNDADRLANCPDRVDPDQWKVLVQYWGTKVAMERSKKNRDSRKSQKMGHTSGRKGHARVREELTKNIDGVLVEPDRVEVFIKTHTKSNGQPVDEASASAIRQLEEGASQIPSSSESPALREELFIKVLKPDRNGHVRTYGLGPCPTQVFGSTHTRSHDQRMKDQLRAELLVELHAEVRAEVLGEVTGEITQLKNQYSAIVAYMKTNGHPLPLTPNGAGDGDGHEDAGGDHTPSLQEHNGLSSEDDARHI